MRRFLIASVLGATLMAGPALAADPVSLTPLGDAASTAVSALEPVTQNADVRSAISARVRRPSALPMLYAASAALQGYDAYSTLSALKSGGVEANPLMKSITKSPAAFVALKAGTATMSIMAAENMWKRGHRAAAIGVMVATNVAMSMVAANNARVLSALK